MDQSNHPPIVATIVVEARTVHSVRATVNGQRHHFSSMDDLFRAAVLLADGPGAKQKGA